MKNNVFWVNKEIIIHESGSTKKTVVNYANFCWEVCIGVFE